MDPNINRQVKQLHDIFPDIEEITIHDVLISTRSFDDALNYITLHPDELVWKGKGTKPQEQEKKFNRTDRPARGTPGNHLNEQKYNREEQPATENRDQERGRGRGRERGRGRGRGGYEHNNTYVPDSTKAKEEPKQISQAAQIWGSVKIEAQSKKAQTQQPIENAPIEAPKPVQQVAAPAPAPAPAQVITPVPAPAPAPVSAPQPVQVPPPVSEKPKPKKQKAQAPQQTIPQAQTTTQAPAQPIIVQNPIPAPPQIQPIVPAQSDAPLNPANFQAFNPQRTSQIKEQIPEKIVPQENAAAQRTPRDDRQRNKNSQSVRLLLPEELKGINPKLELFGLFAGPLPTPAPAPAPAPVQIQVPASLPVQSQPQQILPPQPKEEDFQHQMQMFPYMVYPPMMPNQQPPQDGQMPGFPGFPGMPPNGMQYQMPWGNWPYGGYPGQMLPFQGVPATPDGPPGFAH